MKILMLGWELPPHNSGGLGVACQNMARALADLGAEIDFVVPYDAVHPESDSFMRILPATHLAPLDHAIMGAYSTSITTKTLEDADAGNVADMRGIQKRYVGYIEQLLRTERYDAIHAHDWLTLEAGVRAKEIAGTPLIVHVHATEYDRSGLMGGNPLIHEIEQQGLLMADRILAVSGITKRIIVDNYHIPADKIEVVHNGFDPSSLAADYVYDMSTYTYLESLKSEGYTVVTAITRFTVQKGLTYMMRSAAMALEKYNRLAFLFAGDGEQRDELVQLAADLGIADKVFFTGFVRGKQWRDAYSIGDIFVMSSVSEPFGLTALEAAHHDTALILTNQSGASEVLDNIYRYDFWDVEALADRIVAIATSPALSATLRHNVKAEYARISWHDVAARCLTIYDQHRTGVFV